MYTFYNTGGSSGLSDSRAAESTLFLRARALSLLSLCSPCSPLSAEGVGGFSRFIRRDGFFACPGGILGEASRSGQPQRRSPPKETQRGTRSAFVKDGSGAGAREYFIRPVRAGERERERVLPNATKHPFHTIRTASDARKRGLFHRGPETGRFSREGSLNPTSPAAEKEEKTRHRLSRKQSVRRLQGTYGWLCCQCGDRGAVVWCSRLEVDR